MCSFGISNITNSITTSLAGMFPSGTIKGERANKALTWIGKKISSPQNRLILGASALMSQPFIDLSNKKVDEDTRKISAARTVAKIIAGTLTGFFVRYGCIKAIDYCSLLPSEITKSMKHPKLRMLFTPDSALSGVLKDLGQYKKALGSFIALGVMMITNFMIDAPLTRFLTNKFADKYGLKQNPNSKRETPETVLFPLVAAVKTVRAERENWEGAKNA